MFSAAAILTSMQLVKVYRDKNKKVTAGMVVESQKVDDTITYNNKKYSLNRNLYKVLFIGEDAVDESAVPGTMGYAGQADCLMLLTFDKEKKTVSILEISRDTMADIDMYDLTGNYFATINAQIALQYSYSIGGESSCYATKKSVQHLLNDIGIDGYVCVNMKNINTINDFLGGVTVEIAEDYTEIDASFVKGSTVTLKGGLAEKFVRSRDCEIAKSNELRMERQAQYVTGFAKRVKELRKNTDNFYDEYYDILSPYIITDLSADMINELSTYSFSNDIYTLEGEVVQGEVYEEYHVDEEMLEDMVVKLFYYEI